MALHPTGKDGDWLPHPVLMTLELPVQYRGDLSQATGWDQRPGCKGLVRTLI